MNVAAWNQQKKLLLLNVFVLSRLAQSENRHWIERVCFGWSIWYIIIVFCVEYLYFEVITSTLNKKKCLSLSVPLQFSSWNWQLYKQKSDAFLAFIYSMFTWTFWYYKAHFSRFRKKTKLRCKNYDMYVCVRVCAGERKRDIEPMQRRREYGMAKSIRNFTNKKQIKLWIYQTITPHTYWIHCFLSKYRRLKQLKNLIRDPLL